MLDRVGPWLPDGQEMAHGAPLGVLVGVAAYLFGGVDDLLRSLFVVVLLDVLTGLTAAFIRRQLASHEMVRGVARKLLYFAAVALAVQADTLLPGIVIAGIEVSVRTALVWALLGAEMISIAENLAVAGVPLPPWLVERLKAWQDQQAEGTGRQAGG